MSDNPKSAPPPASEGTAAYLDMPPERRSAARSHSALLSRTAAQVAAQTPLGADIDDFRRVLVTGAKP